MTEWIDFAVYATLILLVFVFLPRHGRQFTLPTIADRNPKWFADHPDIAARIERSRGFLNACYVWAAVSIAGLLAVTLDLIGPPSGAVTPKWELLKDLNSTFLIVGVLVWGVWMLLWLRWLGTHVPLAEMRRATLKPRLTSHYLALPWRIAVETLTVLHLSAWVVIGALGMGGGARYWLGFVFIIAMTILFAVIAAAVPRRRPGFADRLFGDRLRRVELGGAYLLRLTPLITGGMLISEQVYGLDPDRVGHLLLVSVICAMMLLFLRLRPIESPSSTFGAEPRLSA
jgi:hypothetical protein